MSGPQDAPDVAMVEGSEDPRFALQVRIVTTTALRMAGGACDVAASMLLSAALDVVLDSYDGDMPPDAVAMLHKAIDGYAAANAAMVKEANAPAPGRLQ